MRKAPRTGTLPVVAVFPIMKDFLSSRSPKRVLGWRILRRRSLQLLDQQQAWQESEEGEKMQRFRRSLPSYNERDALLTMISQNQVIS
ncbi:hypothetical protein IFM89_033597 [Coptis chinensis]|uniref:Uncharacterized protein n=1 Tax=Coptis chinensis TaxID=261450 RepID=A0A835I954_9MAGN|nr:hypothetical protein IFM89_033597 [Coptis chinensis]